MEYSNPNELWRHNGYDPYKGLSDGERMNVGCMQSMVLAVMIGVMLLICLLLGSCKSIEYVPVVEHQTDTTYITKMQRDSIWLHDSTYVKEYIKGDTCYLELTKWHTKYVEREVHDTIYQAKRDSIPVPYEVIKEVPANLSVTQKGLILVGILTLMVLVSFIAVRLKRFLP